MVMVLDAVFEQDFMDCSYGFRPGRSAHDALRALWKTTMTMHGGWLVEVDIRHFFDELDHGHLRAFVRQRVRDGVILRLIGKWLKAGVMEAGSVSYPTSGTPQGGVISPLLANVYLHEVLDKWIAQRVAPRLRGRVVLVRYADDFVLLFEQESDARRVYAALPDRFEEHGLRLHPDKTRLMKFKQPNVWDTEKPKVSFDFLGFTHTWAKSLSGRFWVLTRQTASDRISRSLRQINQWCRVNRHRPIRVQHRLLSAKLRGHDAYYGITGNFRRLRSYHDSVRSIWRKWLDRRCRKRAMLWERFDQILKAHPLPPARIVHAAKP